MGRTKVLPPIVMKTLIRDQNIEEFRVDISIEMHRIFREYINVEPLGHDHTEQVWPS